MDFASLLGAELSKAKPKTKSYTRKADTEAERLAAYEAEQKALEESRTAKALAKRKAAEDATFEKEKREARRKELEERMREERKEKEEEKEQERRRRLGLPELKKRDQEEEKAREDGVEDVEEEELRRQLRERGMPAVLFGETHWGRVRRFVKLETVVTDGPIPTTLVPVAEEDMKIGGEVPGDKKGRMYLYRQIASYFSMVLKEYEDAMKMEMKKGETGERRTAYGAMVRCREDLKPLYRKLETDTLDLDLLPSLLPIIIALQSRRYVTANDLYLQLSIGKAAWPIGVTMVGIHERSAREKLHKGERGGVMGDEVTRKILQSLKRVISFAQVRWPPGDLKEFMG